MNTMTQEEILKDAIQNPRKYHIFQCALCNSLDHSFIGVFVPTEEFAKRLGQPPGKQRIVIYGLCEQCIKIPDVTDRIEEKLSKRVPLSRPAVIR